MCASCFAVYQAAIRRAKPTRKENARCKCTASGLHLLRTHVSRILQTRKENARASGVLSTRVWQLRTQTLRLDTTTRATTTAQGFVRVAGSVHYQLVYIHEVARSSKKKTPTPIRISGVKNELRNFIWNLVADFRKQ